MTDPIQQHYLPKAAYLKFFENPQKPGSVYFYQRSGKPVLVGTEKVARERHLYSFVDEDGKYNFQVEHMLKEFEDYARPILEKLNYARVPILISYDEKVRLAWFIAMQVVRTPGFRKAIQDLYAGIAEMELMGVAQQKGTLAAYIDQIKRSQPGRIDDNVSVEQVQKFILRGEYDIIASGDHFIGLMVKQAEDIAPAILIKRVEVLRSEKINLVTSDYPVVLMADPRTPSVYGSGFLNSDLMVPIGSRAALIFHGHDESFCESRDPSEMIEVGCRTIRPFDAERINALTIANAQNYLFSCEEDSAIQEIFNKTEEPERIKFSHPFRRKR